MAFFENLMKILQEQSKGQYSAEGYTPLDIIAMTAKDVGKMTPGQVLATPSNVVSDVASSGYSALRDLIPSEDPKLAMVKMLLGSKTPSSSPTDTASVTSTPTQDTTTMQDLPQDQTGLQTLITEYLKSRQSVPTGQDKSLMQRYKEAQGTASKLGLLETPENISDLESGYAAEEAKPIDTSRAKTGAVIQGLLNATAKAMNPKQQVVNPDISNEITRLERDKQRRLNKFTKRIDKASQTKKQNINTILNMVSKDKSGDDWMERLVKTEQIKEKLKSGKDSENKRKATEKVFNYYKQQMPNILELLDSSSWWKYDKEDFLKNPDLKDTVTDAIADAIAKKRTPSSISINNNGEYVGAEWNKELTKVSDQLMKYVDPNEVAELLYHFYRNKTGMAKEAVQKLSTMADNTSSGFKVGQVVNGYRFKGGDATKKSNWEKV